MKNNIKKNILIFLIIFGLNINSSVFEKINNNFKKFDNYIFNESKDEFLKKFKPFAFPLYIGLASVGLYEITRYIINVFTQKQIEKIKIEQELIEQELNDKLKYKLSEKNLYETAIHEIGHLVCLLFNKNSGYSLNFITIIPEKNDLTGYLGCVHQLLKNETLLFNKEQAKALVICSLGGYAAEMIYLKTVKDGCFEDLNSAKNEVKNMILTYGMYGLDLINYNENDDKYKQVASKVFNECLEESKKIIDENKGLIEVLLKELLERKTLYKEDIQVICLNFGIDKCIVEKF